MKPNAIKIKDLKRGDLVEGGDGSILTIATVEKFPLIETAGDTTYEVIYKDNGEEGRMLVGGNTKVNVI
jgi:hypothetical protein